MASARRNDREHGYATAASMMITLAISIAATAVLAGALAEQRSARAQLARTQAAARMDGLQLLAAQTLTRNSAAGRLQWRGADLGAAFEVLAEPEADKLSLAAIAADRSQLLILAPDDLTAAEQALVRQAGLATPQPVAAADPSPLWRACAASLVSYAGQASTVRLSPPSAPREDSLRPHAGEIWRVVVRAGGWSDDRLVRLTGNSGRPSLTLTRTFARDADTSCPLEAAP